MSTFKESVEIHAPLKQVWDAWTDFARQPQLTKNVVEVKPIGPETTHWVYRAPLGLTVEWDARITVCEPERRLCWETTGGEVSHHGCYHFEPTPRGTRLTEEVEYQMPLGPVGDAVAAFLHEPGTQITEDLSHFKEVMEGGRAVHGHAR